MVARGAGGVFMRFMDHMGVSLWKNIKRVWREFSSHTRFEIGRGSKIRF
jgi:hypothetical protein